MFFGLFGLPKSAYSIAAIINFCDGARATTMKPYLDGLLFKLATLLRQNVKMVMEQALTAVAAIADCVEEEFAKYYDTFMPFLISGTRNSHGL